MYLKPGRRRKPGGAATPERPWAAPAAVPAGVRAISRGTPPRGATLPAMRPLFALALPLALALDLDRFRDILRRAQEMIALGGVALALLGSLIFLGTWALTQLRRPSDRGRPWLSGTTLALAHAPLVLTAVAAAGIFLPGLAPLSLKAFALAVVVAALVWCLAVGLVLAGGSRRDLSRGRTALILAGTPWYCLVVYMATYL